MMEIKSKDYCVNCGHGSHCGKPLERWEHEKVGSVVRHRWKIEVCRTCSCDLCEEGFTEE